MLHFAHLFDNEHAEDRQWIVNGTTRRTALTSYIQTTKTTNTGYVCIRVRAKTIPKALME